SRTHERTRQQPSPAPPQNNPLAWIRYKPRSTRPSRRIVILSGVIRFALRESGYGVEGSLACTHDYRLRKEFPPRPIFVRKKLHGNRNDDRRQPKPSLRQRALGLFHQTLKRRRVLDCQVRQNLAVQFHSRLLQ